MPALSLNAALAEPEPHFPVTISLSGLEVHLPSVESAYHFFVGYFDLVNANGPAAWATHIPERSL